VNSPGEKAPVSPPFRLQTFGTLVLRAPEGGTPLADHGQQGQRLALLAVLAAGGEQGCSRDRLLLLVWPDASQQRARHSLEQLLYKMRKSMGESLFAGVNPLRLDPAVITSDVLDFRTRLGAGDFEAAVGHYQGPFLDGFYLGDSPEFEQWVTSERARLESECAAALERLAQAAENRAEHDAAVRWRRELCHLDPLSARHALNLMRALDHSGDHPSALGHAERYARLVQQELGTNVGPEIAALASEMRARAEAEPPNAPRPVASDSGIESHARIPTPPRAAGLPTPPVPVRRPPSRRVPVAIASVASVAILLLAATRLRQAPPETLAPATREVSIAVLPLTNLSGDPADAGLVDGMTEELIAVLGKSANLRVVASTSVRALVDRRLDVRQIADSLRVSHVLEGGLQKIGPRLRMQIRLVDPRDGSTRWSETYDREMGDVFEIQDDIARAVARELDLRLAGGVGPGSSASRHTTSAAAYEWYLRGMEGALMRNEAGRRRGIQYFQRAIAIDSTYAAAYAGLARMYIGMAASGRPREWFAQAEIAARKAVALDGSLGQAHQALGWVHVVNKDWRSAEAELRYALTLDPQLSFTREGLAHVYLWTGKPDRQLEEARLALENDPYSHTAIREYARALLANGRCDEALMQIRALKELSPPSAVAGVIAGQCHLVSGSWEDAITEFRWADQHSAQVAPALLSYALARAGRRDEARAILADLLSGRTRSHGAFGVAIAYAGLGDLDQAFAWLGRAVDEGTLTRDLMLPVFAELHRDPRFEDVRRRLNLEGSPQNR